MSYSILLHCIPISMYVIQVVNNANIRLRSTFAHLVREASGQSDFRFITAI